MLYKTKQKYKRKKKNRAPAIENMANGKRMRWGGGVVGKGKKWEGLQRVVKRDGSEREEAVEEIGGLLEIEVAFEKEGARRRSRRRMMNLGFSFRVSMHTQLEFCIY